MSKSLSGALEYFDDRQSPSTACCRTLVTIDKELTEIRNQNEWLQGLYMNLNTDAVDICLNQLSAAQEKFKVHCSMCVVQMTW